MSVRNTPAKKRKRPRSLPLVGKDQLQYRMENQDVRSLEVCLVEAHPLLHRLCLRVRLQVLPRLLPRLHRHLLQLQDTPRLLQF